MAALQLRGDVYRLLFRHGGKQHTFTIGPVTATESRHWQGKVEHLLMRLEQRLLTLPIGVSIVDFIQHDGKPPTREERQAEAANGTTLHDLRETYIATFSNGAIEANTIGTAKIHLTHLETTFGKGLLLSGLTLGKLQKHIDRRQADVSPVTIKKEIDTFRAVWNWGQRMKLTIGDFPCSGLVYPKTDEKLPFMTWEEIARHIKAGGDAETLWECLYLRPEQAADFLSHAKGVAVVPTWVYPMLVMAAHTGARRSELMRCRVEDIDLENEVVTIREKKRSRGTRTTRRVPVSKLLAEALKPQMEAQAGKTYLFGDGETPISDPYAHKMFDKVVCGSKWEVVKGWHTLRHSFISALASKGVDQRIIDDCVGHCTEEQRRRYRHLFPAVTQKAIASVFG
jgi:integrase